MSTHRNALELADGAAWFKSSYSDQTGGHCVEVANLIPTHARVAVRDSKLPSGPALLLPPEALATFVDHVKADQP
ncbi:protein of unknown function [Streptomyces sp. yr375]|uniref:DUF397 domain-containing protein n=1 Tax=Streptomyces sp. yr375 TaxID=1761906 RepID=UPI0008BF59D4|nr:DUF397 domain-containing protein [Streptomyces sp. yr375]SES46991.1 protein of unknown function [Streptomyces sp. yr375]